MRKLTLLAFAITLLLFAGGCSDQGKSPGDNKATPTPGTSSGSMSVGTMEDEAKKSFIQFIDALKQNDYEKAWAHLSNETKNGFKENGQPSMEKFKKELQRDMKNDKERQEILSAVPLEVEIRARVKIKYNDEGKEKTEEIKMVMEEGRWKMDL